MTITNLARAVDWTHYNSSLLIEVTRPNGVFTCTGVAVTKKVVLTAAHCLDGNILGVKIFTGDHYVPNSSGLAIKDFTLHPDYHPEDSRYKADLAKITLKENLPGSIEIHEIYTGTKLTGDILRFGFGARNGQNIRTAVTPVLRNVDVENDILELNDEFSISGDSGGPIFMQNGKDISLLAIHSTFSHGPQGNFSLNPILAAYKPWIFTH